MRRAVLSKNPLRCVHRRAKRITCDLTQPYLHRFIRIDVMCGNLMKASFANFRERQPADANSSKRIQNLLKHVLLSHQHGE